MSCVPVAEALSGSFVVLIIGSTVDTTAADTAVGTAVGAAVRTLLLRTSREEPYKGELQGVTGGSLVDCLADCDSDNDCDGVVTCAGELGIGMEGEEEESSSLLESANSLLSDCAALTKPELEVGGEEAEAGSGSEDDMRNSRTSSCVRPTPT